ncbi:MAG: type II toxin-antitoxin system VapC family toxin [Chlorobiaceae bacterium]|nr:type II toxin-antitoxin system VapC family toxin [Chlorobiaceae bacterium]NTV60690.1 type II toxin-antitoxin system VapC family toxin [Chlorobiaceae bacterium]
MGKVNSSLERMNGHRVYIDTNVFIYFLDRNPEFFPLVSPLIKAVDSGTIIGVTGDAAIAETLVKPYRTGNPELVASIREFFRTEGFLSIQPHDGETFDLAAQLRATRGMKFIDALHYATALRSGCDFFVTNDTGIQSDQFLEIIPLASLKD